jgi:hypothetical protein
MQRLLSALVVMLVVSTIGAGPVEARTTLQGSYAVTTVESCTTQNNTQFGFDASGAQTVITTDGVFRRTGTRTGVITFHPDGTGTRFYRSHLMNITRTAVGTSIYSVGESSTPFTYTVNDDDTVDISLGVDQSSIALGASAGLLATVNPHLERLAIGNGGNTLVGANLSEIQQETVNFSNGLTQYRLCTRSTTAVRQ